MKRFLLLTVLSSLSQGEALASGLVCHDMSVIEIQTKPDITTYRLSRPAGYVCSGGDCDKAISENGAAVFSPASSYTRDQLNHLFGAASLGYVTGKRLWVCYDSNRTLYKAYVTSRQT